MGPYMGPYGPQPRVQGPGLALAELSHHLFFMFFDLCIYFGFWLYLLLLHFFCKFVNRISKFLGLTNQFFHLLQPETSLNNPKSDSDGSREGCNGDLLFFEEFNMIDSRQKCKVLIDFENKHLIISNWWQGGKYMFRIVRCLTLFYILYIRIC